MITYFSSLGIYSLFLNLLTRYGKKISENSEKESGDPLSLWEGSVFSPIVSIFTKEGNLNGEFSDMVNHCFGGLLFLVKKTKFLMSMVNVPLLCMSMSFRIWGPFFLYCF